jgi:hypothetical protein
MMQTSSLIALGVSIAALGISFYGVRERRNAAWRAERLRFASIIDDLNSLRLEYLQPTTNLQYDAVTDAVNARAELLAVQALVMARKLRRSITSPEYRTLAYELNRAGYPADAERIWQVAIPAATAEGPIQALYAHRGYAYFLFGEGRPDEARAEMELALAAIGSADDTTRIHQIKTFKYWANAEDAENPDGAEATQLLTRAEHVVTSLDAAEARRHMRAFLKEPNPFRPRDP